MATNVEGFVSYIAPIIKAEAQKRGYKVCSTVIAQAIIEGASGTSKLAKIYHNHFGMKCGSSWKGMSVNMSTKEEYKVGTLVNIKDNFRAYKDDYEGVRGYYDFIGVRRYKNLKNAKNYKEFAEMLKADGYATSSTYVNTLCQTVQKYNLQKYDDLNNVANTVKPTLKLGARGEYVSLMQHLLNKKINIPQIAEDGIFGMDTRNMLIIFQRCKNLNQDGVCGPNTWAELLRE